ncbi:MAG: 4Fe-4S dicluster domain-containing protein [bacterium]|nr:4Fe-4S dicluster domain-containing protein [bacterium]
MYEYIVINRDVCGSCGSCVAVCPEMALIMHELCITFYAERCTECDNCIITCPARALSADAETAAVK